MKPMLAPNRVQQHRFLLLSLAWLSYIIVTLTAYPIAGDSVMLPSILLCGVATWLYSYRIGLLTSFLSHPYNMLMMMYHLNSLDGWRPALEIGGVLAQLIAIGCTAILTSNQRKVKQLNMELERKIKEYAADLQEVSDLLSIHAQNDQTILAENLFSSISARMTRLYRESETLLNLLSQEGLPQKKEAKTLVDTAQKSIDFIKQLKRNLPHDYFEGKGLDQMLFALAQFYRDTTSTHLTVELSPRHREIPAATTATLFRIATEAVTNAIRHGKARHIFIDFETQNNGWLLTVINDGSPLPERLKEGTGIQLMKQRATSIDATIDYTSGPGGHTHFKCTASNTQD